jgi:hypothetical protein
MGAKMGSTPDIVHPWKFEIPALDAAEAGGIVVFSI